MMFFVLQPGFSLEAVYHISTLNNLGIVPKICILRSPLKTLK